MRNTLITALIAASLVAACSSNTSKWTADDVEYKLVAIAGDTLSDTNIDRYAAALERAADACPENKDQVSDFVVRGRQIADDMNIDTSILELLQAVPSAAGGLPRVSCRDVVATIVSLQQ